MYRRVLAGIAVFSLTACTTAAKQSEPVARVVCSEGFAPLRFNPDADSLDPLFAKAIDWPAQAARRCSSLSLTVRGLPDPAEDSLGGRRAANVARVLQSFGTPAPSFELGDAQDRAEPSLEVRARP